MSDVRLAFVGNPNCGKTTLFNAYTGCNLKVANWPGVTVESVCQKTKIDGKTYILTDLPGTYSISSYSEEEKATREYLLNCDDVIINVVDASNLERNLYLTLQLLELKKPMVLALNMMDIVKKRGIFINTEKLGTLLGIKVVEVSAKKKLGLYELIKNGDKASSPKEPLLKTGTDVKEKYDRIEEILSQVLLKGKNGVITDKVDKILTHNYLGLPIFFLIMACVFFFTFVLGDYIKIFFENWLESFIMGTKELLQKNNVHSMLVSLIADGIIPGVGGILTFLPNIFILFLCLAFLEDSGYMSRVAYVMDSIMEKVGLSGKAFIPMILGFGCSVPAILSVRTLENKRDRIKTVFAIPFMSCSAKLPVYVMLSKLFFGKYAVLSAFSMYIVGFFMAILMLLILSKNEEKKSNLLIEFPEYRVPDIKTVMTYVWEKVKDYLTKAGTTIFLASILLWLVLHLDADGITENVANSLGAKLGKFLVPIMRPAGLGYWQIIVSLIWGVAAKEAVVSGFSVLYGIPNISAVEGLNALLEMLSGSGFVALNAYSMMLFCLLYTPCVAAIITAAEEIKSYKITFVALIMQLVIAWGVSTIFYQVGRIFF